MSFKRRDIQKEVNKLPPEEIENVYKESMQLLIHEFRTLSERNNAFLIVQTILLGAVGLIIIPLLTSGSFGTEQAVSSWLLVAVSLLGIVFCEINQRSGQNGAEQAYFWRNYMRALEHRKPKTGDGRTWKTLFKLYKGDEKTEDKLTSKYDALPRLPYPYAWLVYPSLFSGIWVSVITIIVIKHSIMTDSWVLCLEVLAVLALWIAIGYSACTRIKDWKKTGKDNE